MKCKRTLWELLQAKLGNGSEPPGLKPLCFSIEEGMQIQRKYESLSDLSQVPGHPWTLATESRSRNERRGNGTS